MANSWFRFKQFTIEQEHAAMKVGTDGVLLGAWATVSGPGSRILDIGTGTGLIALMLAQRTKHAQVDALEIDPSSAGQAKENFQNSPWKERLKCIHTSFQAFSSQCKNRYDLILCNPPYFSGSYKTSSKEKNLARHDDSLSLGDIFEGSVPLLKDTALVSLILPIQREQQALDLGARHQMYCLRKTLVMPAPGKPANRALLEFSRFPVKCREDELTIETGKRHVYSREFKALTEEFYLVKDDTT